MDMAPPQAPPAHVTHEQQAAIDTVARLISLDQWLESQRDTLPALPGEIPDTSRQAYLAAVAAWWNATVAVTPGALPVARRTAYATQLAQLMRDDATLRAADGTLDSEEAAQAATFARSLGATVPVGASVHELTVGGAAYAGAVVLELFSGRTLLFLPDRGWERFDTHAALREDVERRLRIVLAGPRELPGVVRDDIDLAADAPLVATRERDSLPFDAITLRMEALQARRIGDAWDEYDAGDMERDALADLLHQIASPVAHLDVRGVLAHRDMTLQARLDSERLAGMPAEVRSGWSAALSMYGGTLRGVTQIRDDAAIGAPLSLGDFVRGALQEKLLVHGIHDDPDTLRVHVTPAPLDPLKRWFHGSEPSDLPLLDLALQNIGSLPDESFRLTRADGQPVAIDSGAIRAMVRDLDAGTRYIAYLDDAFSGSGTKAKEARHLANTLQHARMRFEAADARVSYYAPHEPRAFIDDHAERGYRWVEAVLDSTTPGRRRKVEGYDVVARQFTYRDVPIAGLLLFGVRSQGGVFRVVAYTPDAPDGRTFREFADRAEAAREFLLNPDFESYLLARLPADFAQLDMHGIRHFKRDPAAKQAHWVLGTGNGLRRQTELDEPMVERDIQGDILDALYDTDMFRRKRDALAATRATNQVDWAQAWELTRPRTPVADAATAIATDIALSVPRAFQAAWRAYDDIKAGDHAAAFVNATESYTAALGVAGLGQGPRLQGIGAAVRAAPGSRVLIATRQALFRRVDGFESRFLAREVSASQAMRTTDGIARIGGKTYVEHAGRLYHVRFDPAIDGWRLNRPGALDAIFSGPAIQRTPAGRWQARQDVGLRGGLGPRRLSVRMERLERLLAASAHEPGAAHMTSAQLFAAYRELQARHGHTVAAALIQRIIDAPPGVNLLGPADWVSWRESLEVGRGLRARTPAVLRTRVGTTATATRPDGSTAHSSQGAVVRATTDPLGTTGGTVTVRPGLPVPSAGPLYGNRAVRELERHEWPAYVWHYMAADDLPPVGSALLPLPQSVHPGLAVHGVPVTTLPPGTPASVIVGPAARGARTPLGERAGGWVRLDLSAFRHLTTRHGGPAMHIFRGRTPETSHLLFLRPAPMPMDLSSGRDIVFRAGTFESGFGAFGAP